MSLKDAIVEPGMEVSIFEGHIKAVTAIIYEPETNTVITGSADGSIRQWDLEKQTQVEHFEGHPTLTVNKMYYDNAERLLISVSSKTAKVWKVTPTSHMEEQAITARRLQKTITKPIGVIGKGHNDDIISSYYNPRHHILFTAGGDFDKTCKQWLCNTHKESGIYERHEHGINFLDFDKDLDLLVTASTKDKLCNLWNTDTGLHVQRIEGWDFDLTCIYLQAKTNHLFVAGDDSSLFMYNIKEAECKFKYGNLNIVGSIYVIKEVPRLKMFLVAGSMGDVVGINSENGDKICEMINGHSKPIIDVIYIDKFTGLVITASHDGHTKLWHCQTGELVHEFFGRPKNEEEAFDIRILPVKEVYVDGSYAVIVVFNPENKMRAENEAFQIRSTLLDHDFNVLACVVNDAATLAAIQEILDKVALTTTRKVKSRFVLYFSCPVLIKNSKHFFRLSGADIEKIRQTCLPMSSLFDFFLEIDCVHQLLISDCEFLCEYLHIDAICRPYENYETDTPAMHALVNIGAKIDEDGTDEKPSAFLGAILKALNGDLEDFKMKKQFVTLSNMYSEIQNGLHQTTRHDFAQKFGFKIVHPIHKNKQAVSSQMIFYNPELREAPSQDDVDDNVDVIIQDSDDEVDLVNEDLIQQLDDAAREIEIKNIFSLLDLNRDGKLSKRECLKIIFSATSDGANSNVYKLLKENVDLAHLLKPGEWQKVFEDIDSDATGMIDLDELIAYVHASSEHTVKESERRSEEVVKKEGEISMETLAGEAYAVVKVLKKAKLRPLGSNETKKVML